MKCLVALVFFVIYSTCFGQIPDVNISADSIKVEGLKPGPNTSAAPAIRYQLRCLGTLQKPAEPLYIINGKTADQNKAQTLDLNQIKTVTILKGEEATAVYGISGENGAIIIQLKQPQLSSLINDSVSLFVLNGVPVLERSELLKIDPSDIESLTILKDEIQIGCRSHKKVVLITTCRLKKAPIL